MFAAVIAAVVLNVAVATALPSPAPSGTSSSDQPVRTVEYKISVAHSNAAYIEAYNDFHRPKAHLSENGTTTIDVMARTPEALAIKVTELTRERGYPAVFLGNVAADGTVFFPSESISEATWVLLRFFGERFAPEKPLTLGESWRTAGGQITVRKVDGRRVTLAIDEAYKIPESISDMKVSGSVIYERGLLVPISGDIVRRRVELHPEGSIEMTDTVHFERTSDSFDKPVSL